MQCTEKLKIVIFSCYKWRAFLLLHLLAAFLVCMDSVLVCVMKTEALIKYQMVQNSVSKVFWDLKKVFRFVDKDFSINLPSSLWIKCEIHKEMNPFFIILHSAFFES